MQGSTPSSRQPKVGGEDDECSTVLFMISAGSADLAR